MASVPSPRTRFCTASGAPCRSRTGGQTVFTVWVGRINSQHGHLAGYARHHHLGCAHPLLARCDWGPHPTVGSFAPEKFKYNKATATYDAQFKVNGHHLAAAMGLPQDKLFSTEGGLSHIEGARLWGGGVGASAMRFGTLDSKGDFSPFKSEGRSAAVIAPTGVVISGHISGDHDGESCSDRTHRVALGSQRCTKACTAPRTSTLRRARG
jgi:hypothetical protein